MSPSLEGIMLDHTSEIVLLVDKGSLKILEASNPALRLLGYQREDLLGLQITDIECGLSDVFFWEEVRQGGLVDGDSIESSYQCANGDTLLTSRTVSTVYSEDNTWLVICAEPLSSMHRNAEELAYATSRLSATLEATTDGILLLDRDGRIINMNQRFSLLWNLPNELLTRHDDAAIFNFIANANSETDVYRADLAAIQPNADYDTSDILYLRDGRIIERKSRPARHGELIFGRVFSFTDVTELQSELRIAATAFETHEALIVTDANQVILKVNHAFTRITGYSNGEVVGRTPRILQSGRQTTQFYTALWESLSRDKFWEGEIWNRRKNGEVYPEWLTITAVIDPNGQATNYVAAFSDITQRKLNEEEIQHLAFYDPLTELPNRRLLVNRLQQALVTHSRSRHEAAILFIDLDNFKMLNDTHGHGIGDHLLKQVAQRLVNCVREGDTVARLGGDEFVVMLEDLSKSPQEAATLAEIVGKKIIASLNQPYQLPSYDHNSTPSIGVTLFGNREDTVEEILKRADLAMYQAKAAGRNTLRFYDPEMQAVVTTRAILDADFRLAIRENQFLLYYQAQVDDEGHVTGAEALVRWEHPKHGLMSPNYFIPLAEETGLILRLGIWVLETACAQLAAWALRPDTAHLTLAVNVSPYQFRQPRFVDQVLAVLDHHGANPRNLKLEVTESLLLDDIGDIVHKMTVLKSRGVSFSLDDFGTGYSSLSYLKRLPLDQLKIDKSFVDDILTAPSDASIAKTIVALAKNLGLSVIAEGVETEAQRDFLANNGCHNFQGYLFGRPCTAENLMLTNRQRMKLALVG